MALNLNKQNLLKSGISETKEVIESCDETKIFVNNLLENERVKYIINENGEKREFSPEKYIFEIDALEIELDSFDSEEEDIPETVIIPFNPKEDNLNETLKEYRADKYKSTKIICLTDKEKVTREKPKGGEYYKIDKKDYREYILKSDIEEEFFNSEKREMTLMELTSLKELTEEEQIQFLEKYFEDFNLKDLEFISKIDELFSYAKDRFKERGGNLRTTKLYQQLEKKTLENEADVLQLLRGATKEGKSKRDITIYCTLLKFMYLYNEMKKNPTFHLLEQIEMGSIDVEEMIRDIFKLDKKTNITKNNKGIYGFKKNVSGKKVDITFRVKNIKSIMKKALAKGEYLKLENFKDLFGMTIYIDEKDKGSIIEIMKNFDLQFYNRKGYVKNKGFLEKQDVKHIDLIKNPEDKKYKYSANKDDRNNGSSKNYTDAKFIGEGNFDSSEKRPYIPKGGLKIGVEIKFLYGTPSEDTNETGMGFHPIYEYFGKFFEAEKNRQPFIRLKTLETYINSIYDEILMNNDLLQQFGKTKLLLAGEIYKELSGKNLPKNLSNTSLRKLFNSEIFELIFKYLSKKYKFKFSTLKRGKGAEIVITTKENRKQVDDKGRGYQFKKREK